MEDNKEICKTCDMCGEEPNIICFDCLSYYCNSCSNFIHGKKINEGHIRDKINSLPLIGIKCEIHKNKKLEYFCLDENSKYFI